MQIRAELVVLPHIAFLSFGADSSGDDLTPLLDFARRENVWLALSLTEHSESQTYFTAVLIDRSGQVAGRYRKAHALPDDDIALGDSLPVFETEFGLVGMTIGTDLYIPEIHEVLRCREPT